MLSVAASDGISLIQNLTMAAYEHSYGLALSLALTLALLALLRSVRTMAGTTYNKL
jgi:hypothetical protein